MNIERVLLVFVVACAMFILISECTSAIERKEFKEKCHAAQGIYVPIKGSGMYCYPKGDVINIR